jgi:putative ABC transport system permease protein
MLRHYLSLTLRHVSRNWPHAGVTILGLAAGFAAAILIGLYVRDEFSFERFISGYEQIYRLETDVLGPGREPARGDTAAGSAAAHLTLDFPDLEGVVRLARSSRWVGRDKAETWERVAWTDPDFFKVLPYPVFAGDPVAALHDPNGLVLTRQVARSRGFARRECCGLRLVRSAWRVWHQDLRQRSGARRHHDQYRGGRRRLLRDARFAAARRTVLLRRARRGHGARRAERESARPA